MLASEEADFGPASAPERARVVADAKNLIRWCLKGEPSQRPTAAQLLAHRFLEPAAAAPAARRMRYHAFMSHAQADASGTVGTLFFAYEALGLHNWIDMRQAKLTLEGMRQGVRDSDVFLLTLSEHVLQSWFCRQEMLCAIAERKPVQLLVEEDARFHPFDIAAWREFNAALERGGDAALAQEQEAEAAAAGEQAGQGAAAVRVCLAPGSPFDGLPAAIRAMVNRALPNAVTCAVAPAPSALPRLPLHRRPLPWAPSRPVLRHARDPRLGARKVSRPPLQCPLPRHTHARLGVKGARPCPRAATGGAITRPRA